jgi:cell division protein FtsI (penicillin-binding protein 3)
MISRAVYLQLLPNAQFEKIKKRQFSKIVKLSSRRGDILDREGKELAASITSYSLFADPHIIADPYAVAHKLGKHFKVSYKTLYKKIKNKSKRFVWIKRRLSIEDYEKIQSWNLRGLGFKEEYKRIYPNKTLAAPILGFVGREQQGLGGLELKLEKVLSGEGQQVHVQRDARGRALVEDGRVFASSPEGSDVYLTIDKDLQYWVEAELQKAVIDNEAEAAWAIILNPTNSEVLAMANFPSFDANMAYKTSPAKMRNKSIHDVYETGSVMKAFSIGGALDKGIVEPNTKINTENGEFKIGKRKITEADKKHSFPSLTVSEILAFSSNIGTSKIALMMTDKALYETLLDFGFGEKSGVELPGEAKGLLYAPPWRDHLTANISFGHGIAVTALQIANAYAAIANGGELNQPFIIKEIRDLEKGEVVKTEKQTLKRVLSEKNASLLKMMLSSVVAEGGSGFNARIDGFPVAGKTGTAQKVNPNGRGYLPGHYISNFAGFVPANDPKYVIYVAVDSPMKKGYYASTVAAPIFRNIAQYALRRDRTSPVYLTDQDLVKQTEIMEIEKEIQLIKKPLNQIQAAKNMDAMPNLKGMTLNEVLRHLNGQKVDLKIIGHGRVKSTYPEQGKKVTQSIMIQMVEDKNSLEN